MNEITYELTQVHLWRFHRYTLACAMKRPGGRSTIKSVIYYVAVPFFFAFAALQTNIWFQVFIAVFAALYTLSLIRNRWDNPFDRWLYRRKIRHGATGQRTVTAFRDGIQLETEMGIRQRPWSEVKTIGYYPGFVAASFHDGSNLLIPNEAFSSLSDVQSFVIALNDARMRSTSSAPTDIWPPPPSDVPQERGATSIPAPDSSPCDPREPWPVLTLAAASRVHLRYRLRADDLAAYYRRAFLRSSVIFPMVFDFIGVPVILTLIMLELQSSPYTATPLGISFLVGCFVVAWTCWAYSDVCKLIREAFDRRLRFCDDMEIETDFRYILAKSQRGNLLYNVSKMSSVDIDRRSVRITVHEGGVLLVPLHVFATPDAASDFAAQIRNAQRSEQ